MITHLTATELNHRFIEGTLSAREIADQFLAKIERLDSSIGAFLAVFGDKVRTRAAELDAKRSRGERLGRLAAVPIAIKDNMHVRGEATTCASYVLKGFRAPFDATVVRLLAAEDALIIGKTNLDEFAMGSSCENSRLQVTRNPWDLSCSPGGSSGGSAASVAARCTPLALGSDTGGSIRQPAGLSGVFGFKPTYGRVSRWGLVAFGSSLDQIGPFAHSMEDLARVMEIIGRHCEKDSTSLPRPADPFLEELKKPVQGLRIGVPWHFLEDLSAEMRALFDAAMTTWRALGAEIVDVDLSILKYSVPTYYILATAEASTNLARFDGIRYGLRSSEAKTLDEIYEFSRAEGFGPEVKRRILLGTFVLSSGYQEAYYRQAQKVRALIIQKFREAYLRSDLIVMPTSPSPAFPLGSIKEPLEMYLEDIYTIGANLAGLPAISVPGGFSKDDKPVGLQIVGPQLQDPLVLRAAYAFSDATKYHLRTPKFLEAM